MHRMEQPPEASEQERISALAEQVETEAKLSIPLFSDTPENNKRWEEWMGQAVGWYEQARAGLETILSKDAAEMHVSKERVFGYPEQYEQEPVPLEKQIEILEKAFPHLSFEHARQLAEEEALSLNRPSHKGITKAERWFVVPKPGAVADTYEKALKIGLDMLAERGFLRKDWWEAWKDRFHVKQRDHTVAALASLGETQEGDALIIPAQLGLQYRGFSPKQVEKLIEKEDSPEFGLDAFTVAMILLTHPHRLKEYKDLWIHCVGEELDVDLDGEHEHLPIFGFSQDAVHFMDSYEKIGASLSGSATGFRWLPHKFAGRKAPTDAIVLS